MLEFIFLISFFFLIFLLDYYSKKKNLLTNKTGELHQSFTSSEVVPLLGGLYLFYGFFIILCQFSSINIILISTFFLIGFFSDLKIIKSPNFRLIFQFIVIATFVFYNQLEIINTRIFFLDSLLEIKYFNILFVIFCILVIVNGSNFIDGVNTNVIGYYIIISAIIIYLGFTSQLFENIYHFYIWIFVCFTIYVLNFCNKIYLGDSGAYFLGFIFSFLLIKLYLINQNISPFFIVLLLWYPGFENLFSLLRKLRINRSPMKPDQNHLHQLIFLFIKSKFKINKKKANTASGSLINLYNLMIFTISTQDIHNTQFQILLILLNLIIYSLVYLRLFKMKLRNNL
jgi:UDP-N-acetylmuramyl pentapeptide phosphotransferase/UDP-N-acetylglucosamine-1-phosphate transferase